MTEIKPSNGHSGLFATKSYAPGDVIVDEMPLAVLAPGGTEEAEKVMTSFFGGPKSKNDDDDDDADRRLWDTIQPPSNIDPEMKGTFKGMAKAGMCYILQQREQKNQEKSEALMSLYCPTSEGSSSTDDVKNEDIITMGLEETIIEISNQAVSYLKHQYHQSKQKSESAVSGIDLKQKDWKEIQKVILIWACNAFDGGRIYELISRINHSCDPNAIVQVVPEGSTDAAAKAPSTPSTPSNRQRVLAGAVISPGEEITISYLGTMLYAETCVRSDILKSTKFFLCSCSRCKDNGKDAAAQIPCPTCHARTPRQALDEDDQYDDDPDSPVQYVVPGSSIPCEHCGTSFGNSEKDIDPKLSKVMTTVRHKVVSYLQDRDQRQKNSNQPESNQDDDEEEELFEHAALASTILGAHHWTTNILSLLDLGRRLSEMSQAMITTQTLPDIESIAAAIDSLQRVCAFVQRLGLKLHMGHLLSDVVIGIARMLVSLGDSKSQKYGAEWLDKIVDYVAQFEPDTGRQKVVAALHTAHEQHDKVKMDQGDDNRKKKAKR